MHQHLQIQKIYISSFNDGSKNPFLNNCYTHAPSTSCDFPNLQSANLKFSIKKRHAFFKSNEKCISDLQNLSQIFVIKKNYVKRENHCWKVSKWETKVKSTWISLIVEFLIVVDWELILDIPSSTRSSRYTIIN